MKELLEQALLPYNMPLTIIVGFLAVYCLFIVIGVVGMDTFDIDLDVDGDAEVGGVSGLLASLFKLVNADKVPTMIVLAMLSFIMWIICIYGNYYFNPLHSTLIALLMYLVAFVTGCFLVKLFTIPLVPFFDAFKKGENDGEEISGSIGIVKSTEISDEFGQVEVPSNKGGAPSTILAKLKEGDTPLPKGSKVIIVRREENSTVYLAVEFKSTNLTD